MAETTQNEGVPPGTPAEVKGYRDVLKSLVGQVVTVANPESYESIPLGFELTTGFYRARITGVGSDCIVVTTEFERRGKHAGKEPVKQFIPIDRIKRVSVMKSDRVIHL